ncbi:MAG: hypothetical protein C4538_04135 [Nitrospiraceae bacterium]|nr:MAG: hypothetical protein C4538_04135 [Nitrospiraceae bacterium]
MPINISKRFSAILICFIVILLSTRLFAWDSIGSYTHRQIAVDAVSLLTPAEYPDIDMFADNLIEYSADENCSHGWDFLWANGGDTLELWRDKVSSDYNGGDYGNAYEYIGCILHLVEDQGVPSHAFDINHGVYWAWGWERVGDFVEKYANKAENDQSYYSYGSISIQPGNDPVAFYGNMISRTQSVVITNIVTPPPGETWSDYWQPGTFGPLQFPPDRSESWYVIQHDNLVRQRITESINYVAGNMAAASKKLPPLIQNMVIVPTSSISPQIDITYGTQISLQIFENRKPTVKIFMTVDSSTGAGIIDSSYRTGKSFTLTTGTSLPWEGNYTITWDGFLEDGTYPSDGQHTLYVQVQDEDGNLSSVSTHLFTIYTTPVLTISKTGNGTVTASGISCGNDCSQSYAHGTPVTLTATPDSGWTFGSWSGCDSTSGTNCYVTMNGDKTVTAQFTWSGNWTKVTVDSAGSIYGYTSLVIDSNDKIHISYYDETNHVLKYATNVSGSWSYSSLGISCWGANSIAVDSSNKIHISCYDGFLHYVTNSPGYWYNQTIDNSSRPVGDFNSIAINSLNKVYISYSDAANGDLKYATNASGYWNTYTLDSYGIVGSDTSIAIDSSNKLHISYHDVANGNLKYATNTSGVWNYQTPDNNSGDVGEYTSIAVDSLKKVHISYYDVTNGNLKYATNASGSWSLQTIDSGGNVGLDTSIAIDSNNKVHISYYDATNGNLKYATNASGSWIIKTVDSSDDVGEYSSIAIDSLDYAHISYSDSTHSDLKYANNAAVTVDKYTLVVSKSGSGTGAITSAPVGINCGGICRESYDQDTLLTLTATPDINSTFNGWSGGGCSGTGTCEVTVDSDISVTATFNSKMSTISAIYDSGKGVISPSSALVTYGDDQTFSITANAGYHITNVFIDGSPVGTVPAYTFSNVISAHTIEASFAINTYLIAGSAGTGGGVSPSQSTVNYGGSQTVSITPNSGYHVADVLIDGVSIGPVSSYQFTNITADHLVEAIFEPDCTPTSTDETICNGVDDDCDSSIDEDYIAIPTTCGTGACASSGQMQCQNGSVVDTCTPGTPASNDSVCNGIDDDCNGLIDEDYVVSGTNCGTGVCASTGQNLCQNGAIVNTCVPFPPNAPTDTTCNGIDDDCNGQIDEDYPVSPTNCGIGACASTGQMQCQGGSEINTCTPGTPQIEGPYSSPTCSDSVDNDCDGLTDINDPACPPPPTWTDDSLIPGATELKAIHITELRNAVNLLRNKRGFGSYNWTDPTLTSQSSIIRGTHITELRNTIDQAIGAQSWTDNPIQPEITIMKAIHIQELRDAIENAW